MKQPNGIRGIHLSGLMFTEIPCKPVILPEERRFTHRRMGVPAPKDSLKKDRLYDKI